MATLGKSKWTANENCSLFVPLDSRQPSINFPTTIPSNRIFPSNNPQKKKKKKNPNPIFLFLHSQRFRSFYTRGNKLPYRLLVNPRIRLDVPRRDHRSILDKEEFREIKITRGVSGDSPWPKFAFRSNVSCGWDAHFASLRPMAKSVELSPQPVKVKPCSATLDHLSSGKISRVKLARFPPDARRQELIEKSWSSSLFVIANLRVEKVFDDSKDERMGRGGLLSVAIFFIFESRGSIVIPEWRWRWQRMDRRIIMVNLILWNEYKVNLISMHFDDCSRRIFVELKSSSTNSSETSSIISVMIILWKLYKWIGIDQ